MARRALHVAAEFPTCGATDVDIVESARTSSSSSRTHCLPSSDSPPRPSSMRCRRRGSRHVTTLAYESPELVRLFETYAASPTSIGVQYAETSERATQHNPLLVATGTDLALYPGGGEPPVIEGFRMSTRGFKEMAAVSHLGPAVATLARMKERRRRTVRGVLTRKRSSTPPGRRGGQTPRICGATASASPRSPAARTRSPRWSTTAAESPSGPGTSARRRRVPGREPRPPRLLRRPHRRTSRSRSTG